MSTAGLWSRARGTLANRDLDRFDRERREDHRLRVSLL